MSRGALLGLCALMSVWVLAFAPEPWAGATVFGVVSGLALIEGAGSFRRAAGYLVLFGAVAIGFGYRWLVPTVELFGGLSTPAAIGVLIVFGVAGTVHALLFAGLYRALFVRGGRPHPIATAALLVACELLPIRFFPWTTGHGVVDVAPLRQLAEWGGLALVSFATLCLVVPVHELLVATFQREGPPARPRAALATLLVGGLLYGLGAWRHGAVVAGDRAATSRVRVGIVQANIGSLEKRNAEKPGDEARRTREAYERLSRQAASQGAELVVWPETALMGVGEQRLTLYDPASKSFRTPATISRNLETLGWGWIDEIGADRTFLVGGYEDEPRPRALDGARAYARYNVAMLREPGGGEWSIYRKVKLIPFGETVPGEDLLPAIGDMIRLPQKFKMEAGSRDQPPLTWKAKDLVLVPFVCYEAILPDFVWERARGRSPDLLVNLTNDSWYGDTWEPHQHLNFSRFRAVEHRRPMVRATNTGISAFVDAAGDVVARLGYDREGVLVHDVPLVARGRTLFGAIGGWVSWIFWAVGLGIVVVALVRPSRWETSSE